MAQLGYSDFSAGAWRRFFFKKFSLFDPALFFFRVPFPPFPSALLHGDMPQMRTLSVTEGSRFLFFFDRQWPFPALQDLT